MNIKCLLISTFFEMMRNLATFVAVMLLLTSCLDDTPKRNLDSELIQAIYNASDGKGLTFYQFPNIKDYSIIPQDPNNPITASKVELGMQLFHETAFALNGNFGELSKQTYSCASCHNSGAGFQSGLKQGIADGGMGIGLSGEGRLHNPDCDPDSIDTQPVRVPSNMNKAYQPNVLWNGAFGATAVNEGTEHLWSEDDPTKVNFLGYEGLESQAIAGLEVHRMEYSEELISEFGYKDLFDEAFPNLEPERRYSFEGAGLAIAAFERTKLANEAPFQKWLNGHYDAMNDDEMNGAILFFGKAGCVECHNGPSFANMEFHALGMNDFSESEQMQINEDAKEAFKGRASFTKRDQDLYKFKVPQLYNLRDSRFYGHGSSFERVFDVVQYKNVGQAENPNVSIAHLSEKFVPLELNLLELGQITAFIESALYDPELDRYVPDHVQSGLCFPNNDPISREEMGCN